MVVLIERCTVFCLLQNYSGVDTASTVFCLLETSGVDTECTPPLTFGGVYIACTVLAVVVVIQW